ncbi:MAG: sensor histidine kinase, partial [Gemmataceae bacterium]
LSIIRGGTDIALGQIGAFHRASDPLRAVQEATDRAAELCRQMLAFTGKQTRGLRTFSLTDLIQDSVRMAAPVLSEAFSVQFHFPSGLPHVCADYGQLQQVFLNLILNARDAMPGGAGSLSFRAEQRNTLSIPESDFPTPDPDDVQSAICITATDNGCGMDEITRSQIFEPFFTTKPEGRGLGLAAAIGIVRAHGGSIAVRSKIDVGTTFTIVLPAQPCSGDVSSPQAESSTAPSRQYA